MELVLLINDLLYDVINQTLLYDLILDLLDYMELLNMIVD